MSFNILLMYVDQHTKKDLYTIVLVLYFKNEDTEG